MSSTVFFVAASTLSSESEAKKAAMLEYAGHLCLCLGSVKEGHIVPFCVFDSPCILNS